jgi:hypothetical protein
LDTIRATPWTNQTTTSSKQKAKKGARLASLAANPANLSKNPILLETSLGSRTGVGFSLMDIPSCGRTIRVRDAWLIFHPPDGWFTGEGGPHSCPSNGGRLLPLVDAESSTATAPSSNCWRLGEPEGDVERLEIGVDRCLYEAAAEEFERGKAKLLFT